MASFSQKSLSVILPNAATQLHRARKDVEDIRMIMPYLFSITNLILETEMDEDNWEREFNWKRTKNRRTSSCGPAAA